MKENNKLIDAIIDLGVGMKELREEMKGMREEIKEMRKDINKQSGEQHKTNVLLTEHTQSIMALAEKISVVVDHEKRINKIERTAYH